MLHYWVTLPSRLSTWAGPLIGSCSWVGLETVLRLGGALSGNLGRLKPQSLCTQWGRVTGWLPVWAVPEAVLPGCPGSLFSLPGYEARGYAQQLGRAAGLVSRLTRATGRFHSCQGSLTRLLVRQGWRLCSAVAQGCEFASSPG